MITLHHSTASTLMILEYSLCTPPNDTSYVFSCVSLPQGMAPTTTKGRGGASGWTTYQC